MSILVLGASGQIGAYTVQDLIEFGGEKDVIVSSRKMANVKRAMDDLKLTERTKLMELDANNGSKVLETIRNEKVESVVNCAWYQTNLGVMDACLKGGATYTDLGGFFDTCLKQIELHNKWKDAGINATIGLGSTPGMTNVAGAAGAKRLDQVDSIDIVCAWGNTLPVQEAGWPGYSIRTVLDEFTQESVQWLGGKYAKQKILGGEADVLMPDPIGKIKAYFIKHSEPATMGKYLNAKNVTFRIGFPKTDMNTFLTLRSLGFADTNPLEVGGAKVSPLDYLTAMYQKGIAEGRSSPPKEKFEYDMFRVDCAGKKDGMPKMVTYFIVTWNDPDRGVSSARDTSVPPSIVAHWQHTKRIKEPGVFPAEATVEPEAFFKELGKRKILVDEQTTTTTKYY
ncbi:MAG: saccharopine dehydrogenase NADP-binding domain-containing protein [Candidatus Thermoplasmatota archaeon]|nr:saccharopine dehydrogenase NADP-binding domain-containing protein [Candidatus Thermoplasmatota archaeon]